MPTRIALIGDIHANLPALEAVLAHARGQGVKTIWNTGDSVGYGAFPDQVVRLLQSESIVSVIGNYDLKVLNFPSHQKKYIKHKRPEKYLAFQWAYDHLSQESHSYLASLPHERLLEIEGKRGLLIHASQASKEEILTPETPKSRLKALHKMAEKKFKRVDMLIFGHSHQAFFRQVGANWYINTGSVGRPDDGDPRAAYVLLDMTPDRVQVELFRIEYDLNRAVEAIRQQRLPEAFAQMLIQGVDLENVHPSS